MSMYTNLLDAAYGERAPVPARATRRSALNAVRRCRGELARDTPHPTDPDGVPVVLAREIRYDVALLQLAEVLGVETDTSRFEQPWHERARLEQVFLDQGIALNAVSDSGDGTLGAT